MSNLGRRRGRPPVHSRPALLEAATATMMERGFEGLRFADVARRSGVPVASLRHYFPTVAGLRMDALRAMVQREFDLLVAAVADLSGPWERIEHIVTSSVRPSVPGDCLEWLLWLDYFRAAGREPTIAEDKRRSDAAYRALYADTVRAGVAQGVFTLDVPADEAAWEILATIDGYGAHLAVPHDEKDEDRYVELALRSVRRLLGVAPVGRAGRSLSVP